MPQNRPWESSRRGREKGAQKKWRLPHTHKWLLGKTTLPERILNHLCPGTPFFFGGVAPSTGKQKGVGGGEGVIQRNNMGGSHGSNCCLKKKVGAVSRFKGGWCGPKPRGRGQDGGGKDAR